MQPTLAGALAGFVATVPMSALMLAGQPALPPGRRRLPPKQITMRLARLAGARPHPDGPATNFATTAAHFGYGTMIGAMYGALAARRPDHPLAKGMAFGLLVWAGSYLGWLPAAGVRQPATRDPTSRNVLMIAAHLVWGAGTAYAFDKMRAAGNATM